MDPNTCQPAPNDNRTGPETGYLDLSRGARRYNLRPENLWLAVGIWDDYAEVNSALGLNLAGVILSALAGRYAHCPEGMSEDVITVALRRQKDDEQVEVDLQVHRVEGGASGSFVLLRKIEERPLGSMDVMQARNNPTVCPGDGGGGGGKKSDAGPLCRWTFYLQDHPPGPSFGDAMEFIEGLGIDPWSFENVDLSDEWWEGPMAVSAFEVIGTQKQLDVLRDAYWRHTGETAAALERCDACANSDARKARENP